MHLQLVYDYSSVSTSTSDNHVAENQEILFKKRKNYQIVFPFPFLSFPFQPILSFPTLCTFSLFFFLFFILRRFFFYVFVFSFPHSFKRHHHRIHSLAFNITTFFLSPQFPIFLLAPIVCYNGTLYLSSHLSFYYLEKGRS